MVKLHVLSYHEDNTILEYSCTRFLCSKAIQLLYSLYKSVTGSPRPWARPKIWDYLTPQRITTTLKTMSFMCSVTVNTTPSLSVHVLTSCAPGRYNCCIRSTWRSRHETMSCEDLTDNAFKVSTPLLSTLAMILIANLELHPGFE